MLPSAYGLPLRVRVRTTLTTRAHHDASGITLSGVLSDDQNGPLPGRVVRLLVTGLEAITLTTGDEGTFELRVGSREVKGLQTRHGRLVPWNASFDGGPLYGAADLSGTLDLLRASTWITLKAHPPIARSDAEGIRLRVGVHAQSGPVVNAEVALEIAGGPVVRLRTDTQGQATLLVRPVTLPKIGELPASARFHGDTRFSPSDAHLTFNVRHPTRTTLRVGREGTPETGRYRFSGRLSDALGPVSSASVTLLMSIPGDEAAPELVGRGTTDTTGRYLVTRSAADLSRSGVQGLEVYAIATPPQATSMASRSGPVAMGTPLPPGLPFPWVLAGLAWMAALLGATRWLRGRRWSALWNRHKAVGAVKQGQPPPRRRRRRWISGSVADAHADHLLAGATVSLVSATGESLEILTGPDGAFSFGTVAPGVWALEVRHRLHMKRTLSLRVPHDGQADGWEVSLVATHQHVRIRFERLLARMGHVMRWGFETPREAVGRCHIPTRGAPVDLALACGEMERVWYAEGEVDEAEADRVARAIEPDGDTP